MNLGCCFLAVALVPLKCLLNLDCLFLSAGILTMSLFVILVKSLCGLEASCVPSEEVLSVSGESCDSSDEMDTKESISGRTASRKKKSKRHKGTVRLPASPGVLFVVFLRIFCMCDVRDFYLQASNVALQGIL